MAGIKKIKVNVKKATKAAHLPYTRTDKKELAHKKRVRNEQRKKGV